MGTAVIKTQGFGREVHKPKGDVPVTASNFYIKFLYKVHDVDMTSQKAAIIMTPVNVAFCTRRVLSTVKGNGNHMDYRYDAWSLIGQTVYYLFPLLSTLHLWHTQWCHLNSSRSVSSGVSSYNSVDLTRQAWYHKWQPVDVFFAAQQGSC